MTNARTTDLAAAQRRQLRRTAQAVLAHAEQMRAEAALLKAASSGRAPSDRVVQLARARG